MPIKQINSAELIKIFKENKAVCVLDVRTDGEWLNIGRPDAEALGVETKFLSLMLDKDGQRVFNENFQIFSLTHWLLYLQLKQLIIHLHACL